MTKYPRTATASLLATALLVGGCSFIPAYERPAAPVPAVYATSAANGVTGAEGTNAASPSAAATAAPLPWHDYFAEPRLRRLIETALAVYRLFAGSN